MSKENKGQFFWFILAIGVYILLLAIIKHFFSTFDASYHDVSAGIAIFLALTVANFATNRYFPGILSQSIFGWKNKKKY